VHDLEAENYIQQEFDKSCTKSCTKSGINHAWELSKEDQICSNADSVDNSVNHALNTTVGGVCPDSGVSDSTVTLTPDSVNAPSLEQIDSTSPDEFDGEILPDPWEEEVTPDVKIKIAPTPDEVKKEEKGQLMWAITIIDAFTKKIEQLKEQEEWNDQATLEDMAKELNRCESIERLQVLRLSWRNPEALNAAAKLLTPEKHAQIKKWVEELNKTNPVFQVGDVCTYEGKESGFQKICRKHKLEIVAIEGDEANVISQGWNPSIKNTIPLVDLKLIR
jgi:hypothetical protein